MTAILVVRIRERRALVSHARSGDENLSTKQHPAPLRLLKSRHEEDATSHPGSFESFAKRGSQLPVGLVDLSHEETLPRWASVLRATNKELTIALPPTSEPQAFQRRVLLVSSSGNRDLVIATEAHVARRNLDSRRLMLTLEPIESTLPTRITNSSQVTLNGGVAVVTDRKTPREGQLISLGLNNAKLRLSSKVKPMSRAFSVLHPTGAAHPFTVEATLVNSETEGQNTLTWAPEKLPTEPFLFLIRHLHGALRALRPILRPTNAESAQSISARSRNQGEDLTIPSEEGVL